MDPPAVSVRAVGGSRRHTSTAHTKQPRPARFAWSALCHLTDRLALAKPSRCGLIHHHATFAPSKAAWIAPAVTDDLRSALIRLDRLVAPPRRRPYSPGSPA